MSPARSSANHLHEQKGLYMHVPLVSPSHRPGRLNWLRYGAVGALVLALSVPATAASAASAPGYLTDPSAAPGTYSEQNVGADRTADDFFYRIPALAHVGGGVVIAAWDARPGSAADAPNPNSIIQRRSTDNGQTWGPLQIIAAGQAGAAKYGYSDPSYVVDKETDRVFAFFVHSKDQGFQGSVYGDDDANRQVMGAAVIHSDDQGLTWSAPRLITDVAKTSNGTTAGGVYTPVAGDVKGTFATSGEGIQLQYGPYAGRLIQQYAGRVLQSDGSTAIQAYSVYSDDNGETWQRGEFVGTGMDENKVVELSDGRVMLNSRDSANGRMRKVAISTDGGQTYGPVTRDAELPDPTNNASITRLHPDAAQGSADAKKLIFTNANNGANGDRVNGGVRLSCDDGETWPGLRTIETGTFGYSTATAMDEGRVGVLWEAGYTNTMQFSSFDEAWLNAVCAPLSVPQTALTAGAAATVPVTVTNQEDAPLSGTVSFYTATGWNASTAEVTALAPGASTTVNVQVTAPQDAAGAQRVQAAFTGTDGRVSQTTAQLTLPRPSVLGATLTVADTSASRDLTTNPYKVGEQLSFQVRVVSTAGVNTLVTPAANTFTTGFSPTACRWRDLPAYDSYNCNTPRRTLTQADIDRGWYTPEFAFTVAPVDGSAAAVTVTHTGAPVVLRDGVLDATITGSRTDAARDLAADPYEVGEQVPYAFRVDNRSPLVTTVVPTSGDFAPLLPPGAGNCRYRNLAVGAGYDCGTPRHTVTQVDIDRGFFVADTTWTVEAAGQTTKELTVAAGEVDVIARAPQLAGASTGEWIDENSNGVADASDTVTWTRTVTNTGNVVLEDVAAGEMKLGSLAPGDSAAVEPVVIRLTTEDIARGSVSAEPLAVSATNGARDVEGSVGAATLALQTAPAWNAETVYTGGELVSFDGRLWKASWWTRNQTPGDVTGPWQELATDQDGEIVWTATRIFNAGDVVVHDGIRFEARWWTRNQTPDASTPRGPWERID